MSESVHLHTYHRRIFGARTEAWWPFRRDTDGWVEASVEVILLQDFSPPSTAHKLNKFSGKISAAWGDGAVAEGMDVEWVDKILGIPVRFEGILERILGRVCAVLDSNAIQVASRLFLQPARADPID